ncbi:MAG: thiamine-phosphate pyrophosphorylase [Chitinispirillia bacterium]|nr:thiamine-phosphate pyrophosphorylase [Chitinispirillia bacterium]MCL2269452.1 thiamine-phosphate pyrophosphorylase [Chitinispirillia bacterium]
MQDRIYRILDANFNRLREGLRVVEEYFRFIEENEGVCVSLKQMRHLLTGMEKVIGQDALLAGRDTENDCFASEARPEEMSRVCAGDVLCANFKRAQEASRVIEEYAKICGAGHHEHDQVSRNAKEIRFALYELQKSAAQGNRPATGLC